MFVTASRHNALKWWQTYWVKHGLRAAFQDVAPIMSDTGKIFSRKGRQIGKPGEQGAMRQSRLASWVDCQAQTFRLRQGFHNKERTLSVCVRVPNQLDNHYLHGANTMNATTASQTMQCKGYKAFATVSRYASINNHLGLEQSRRDDLESIGSVGEL